MKLHGIEIDPFTQAYFKAALWSSTDDADVPMNRLYGMDDLSEQFVVQSVADCKVFQATNHGLIDEDNCRSAKYYNALVLAGHDFWLTRCGHGCGFWDGDWKAWDEEKQAWDKTPGELLTQSAKRYRNVDLYVGDDGLIYGC